MSYSPVTIPLEAFLDLCRFDSLARKHLRIRLDEDSGLGANAFAMKTLLIQAIARIEQQEVIISELRIREGARGKVLDFADDPSRGPVGGI
ncbi:MAG: hypothetical protein KDH19_06930 [Geminicoccaceae bacterium]|nr:hypothetical protein [Geminicoccaceae bacterium]